jgi:hypothetical protein
MHSKTGHGALQHGRIGILDDSDRFLKDRGCHGVSVRGALEELGLLADLVGGAVIKPGKARTGLRPDRRRAIASHQDGYRLVGLGTVSTPPVQASSRACTENVRRGRTAPITESTIRTAAGPPTAVLSVNFCSPAIWTPRRSWRCVGRSTAVPRSAGTIPGPASSGTPHSCPDQLPPSLTGPFRPYRSGARSAATSGLPGGRRPPRGPGRPDGWPDCR